MEDLDHCDWKLVLQELFQGREAAAKLRGSLSGVHESEDESPAKVQQDLAQMVAGSFTKALSLLGHCEGTASDRTAASSCLSSTDSALPSPRPGKVNGRGRYKRWKSCNSWMATTPALVDDGHTWRKYGQKPIHGSDFPRSYFRCTHKND
ncbi:hypothetical protein MLD38_032591 [Melastoma candidum]|uniref:Uncharacterized protein n=1 Tax=Melastoma candidum TaxID=119954 RepID=A0ACB9M4G3_9MYRT|nr:hypothetical protein MLD38_032591 [Melastoma candidum]